MCISPDWRLTSFYSKINQSLIDTLITNAIADTANVYLRIVDHVFDSVQLCVRIGKKTIAIN